uniref:Uncharacterized protein n=1 Tax=Athene cunicularia TaxID=194338 RepID=A0A663LMS2_ATHCN
MKTYHSLLFILAYKKSINSGHALGAVSSFRKRGGKSREKVVKILVSVTPDEILEKLKKEASS